MHPITTLDYLCAWMTFLASLLFALTRAHYFRRLARNFAGSSVGSLVFGAAGLICMFLSGNVRPVVGIIWRLP